MNLPTDSSGIYCPKILSIDDDPEISEALALRFAKYDVEILRAYHGMNGFWVAMTERPDAIITDMKMPQGEGDYVVECLRRNSDTQDIPVFVLSGCRDAELKKKMLSMGVSEYFTKPAALDELVEAISSAVNLQEKVYV